MNNMRTYAFVQNNDVVEVKQITDEQYQAQARDYQLIIDVTDFIYPPQVGWKLSGNQLVPPAAQQISLKLMIEARIKSYQDMAPALLREMYANNTLAGITSEQSAAIFTDYADILLCIREGAWPTAVYKLSQKTPEGFVTQERLDAWTQLLLSRMV